MRGTAGRSVRRATARDFVGATTIGRGTAGRAGTCGATCGGTNAGTDRGTETWVQASTILRTVFVNDPADGTLLPLSPFVGGDTGRELGQHGAGRELGVEPGTDDGTEVGRDCGGDWGDEVGRLRGAEPGTEPTQHAGAGAESGIESGAECGRGAGNDTRLWECEGTLRGSGKDGAYCARHSRLRCSAASPCAAIGNPTTPTNTANPPRATSNANRRKLLSRPMERARYPPRRRDARFKSDFFYASRP